MAIGNAAELGTWLNSEMEKAAVDAMSESTQTATIGMVQPTVMTDFGLQQQQDMHKMQQEARMQVAQQEAVVRQLMQQVQHMTDTPFEETEEFRDFVVWLCGFTDRDSPPEIKDWKKLRSKTKQVAAKFALKAREDARAKLREAQVQPDYFQNITSGYAQVSKDTAAWDELNSGTSVTYTTATTSSP
jgi:hypothetical protein